MKKTFYAIAAGFLISAALASYSQNVQADISKNVVRLHILANSDSEADQALKLKVRDRIIAEMAPVFSASSEIADTKLQIQSDLGKIQAIAKDELEKNGSSYPATAYYGKFDFPTKTYDDIRLPPGEYDAVRVVIGDGAGKNWWCVLYPPLCFIDGTNGTATAASKDYLRSSLSSDEYGIITSSHDSAPNVELKFKIVELFLQYTNKQ